MIHFSCLCSKITTLKRQVQIVSNGLFLKEILNHENPFQFGKTIFIYPFAKQFLSLYSANYVFNWKIHSVNFSEKKQS